MIEDKALYRVRSKGPVPIVRKGRIEDIKDIQALINSFAKKDLMLPRSLNELYDNLRDYWVAEEKNKIIGCSALHISWGDLAEIKSVAVRKQDQGRGVGRELIINCIEEAKGLGAKKIFVLTYRPDYFKKFGFKKVRHNDLPHKVWAECINCPKFPNCQEIALLKTL
jgi:amino-acid N-acetyltransferase